MIQDPGEVVATPIEYDYAGFWWRLAAFIIDVVILGIAGAIVGRLLGLGEVGGLFGFVAEWIYFAAFESSTWRATPGKRACGIVVVDTQGRRITFGRASGRFFGKILSGIILGIGYLMIAFTERKQGLHDMLAGALVLRERRPATANWTAVAAPPPDAH